jgi:hypothetical protein
MLYKYRDFNNFERVLDIILNKRLYAAVYEDLNDPMEGIFKHRGLLEKTLKKLKADKEELRICSLSKRCDNPLMWALYADGEKGIVIGINEEKLTSQSQGYDFSKVIYSGIKDDVTEETTAIEILSYKEKDWKFEKEFRFFTKESYVNIEIEQIIMGSKISSKHEDLINNLKNENGYDFEIKKLENVLYR